VIFSADFKENSFLKEKEFLDTQKIKELETELFLCKESLSKAKDEFSKQTIEHSASLSHSQSELMKLALDLSSSRHEVEEKTAELSRKSIELEDLRSKLMEAQSNIDLLSEEKNRIELENKMFSFERIIFLSLTLLISYSFSMNSQRKNIYKINKNTQQ
jgi:hypothetical protein